MNQSRIPAQRAGGLRSSQCLGSGGRNGFVHRSWIRNEAFRDQDRPQEPGDGNRCARD